MATLVLCMGTGATQRRAARGAQAVQGAVAETLPDAVQAAVADRLRFDVRANVLTLLAITGVIMYWRGIWSLWRAPLRRPAQLAPPALPVPV